MLGPVSQQTDVKGCPGGLATPDRPASARADFPPATPKALFIPAQAPGLGQSADPVFERATGPLMRPVKSLQDVGN